MEHIKVNMHRLVKNLAESAVENKYTKDIDYVPTSLGLRFINSEAEEFYKNSHTYYWGEVENCMIL